jgi:hypothetical protein
MGSTYFNGANGLKEREVFIFDKLADMESCLLSALSLYHGSLQTLRGMNRGEARGKHFTAKPYCPAKFADVWWGSTYH